MAHVDYLIVGQGIAGTCLSFACLRRGLSCKVITDPGRIPASLSAPALINPVTGRKFVKSWMTDQLIPAAIKQYGEFEALLGERFLQPIQLLRALADESAKRQWELRGLDAHYSQYVDGIVHLSELPGLIPFQYGEVRNAFRVHVERLLQAWNSHLQEKGALLEESFDHRLLVSGDQSVRYRDFTAKAIIFCEGHHLVSNPFVKANFILPNKGDYLQCRIPGLKLGDSTVLKIGLFLVPQGEDRFWVGSTYEKNPISTKPGKIAFQQLSSSLRKVLRTDWAVLEHKAAIRPTIKDRRPILGRDPRFSNVYFFNGLGTKGASLAPFFSEHLTDVMMEKDILIPEVDLRRFFR